MQNKNAVKQHQLYLVNPTVWKRLLKSNQIDEIYRDRARKITFFSNLSYPLQQFQKLFFDKTIRQVNLENNPPIFILGHWRSGTTHLHYLLSQDPRLGILSNYQAFLFNVAFLSTRTIKTFTRKFFPETRPQDNISISPDAPAEEEQPFCTFSPYSGIHGFFFPRNKSYFEKYNLFKGISFKEKKGWKRDYKYLIKAIALFNNNRDLVLKNPHNTGRVKELLELFPNAKFIFLHRNPYVVFQSSMHLFNKLVRTQFLQEINNYELQNLIINNFRQTLEKYIREKEMISENNLVEVAFDELESEPLHTMAKIYSKLNLPGFENARPEISNYLKTVKNYKKNKFEEIPRPIKSKLENEWDFFFDYYNYRKSTSLVA